MKLIYTVLLLAAASTLSSAGTSRVRQNEVVEWQGQSSRACADPFNEVTLDAFVTLVDGSEQRVPACWA